MEAAAAPLRQFQAAGLGDGADAAQHKGTGDRNLGHGWSQGGAWLVGVARARKQSMGYPPPGDRAVSRMQKVRATAEGGSFALADKAEGNRRSAVIQD